MEEKEISQSTQCRPRNILIAVDAHRALDTHYLGKLALRPE